ncbi:MAG TPA: dienelactone hydrolase family protein [Acidimicrobiales bacterium]
MTITTRTEQVTVDDGQFDLHVWVPSSGSGPGLLLIQEIFGVGPYLRAVAERLADAGYVVGAPDVFWRLQPNWEAGHDEKGLTDSIALVGQFDFDSGITDCVAALVHVGGLPEVQGGTGVIGFCLGGLLTYHVAARAEPVAAVSYYGSNIAAGLGLADQVTCPIQFHFGENDPYIPLEQVELIKTAMDGREHAEVHVQAGAGHAFDNHEAAMFHHPEAAAVAWALTMGFLGKHLPVS